MLPIRQSRSRFLVMPGRELADAARPISLFNQSRAGLALNTPNGRLPQSDNLERPARHPVPVVLQNHRRIVGLARWLFT